MTERDGSISPPAKRRRISEPELIDLTSQDSGILISPIKAAPIDLTVDDYEPEPFRASSNALIDDSPAPVSEVLDQYGPKAESSEAIEPANGSVGAGIISAETPTADLTSDAAQCTDDGSTTSAVRVLPSPIQLNAVAELSASGNRDTTTLRSILGNPLIKECWLFNYLFDVDYILDQFDADVRSAVQIKIVHGSWQNDDRNGIGIEQAASIYPNIQNIKAYMPEAFGTHHSKMIILFRHDDLAQVVITTGNFIERDWRMSQAFWCSPLLPLASPAILKISGADAPIGSGPRFKFDLLAYIIVYGLKLSPLYHKLIEYDFTSVRGALIASVPGKQELEDVFECTRSTAWGWPAVKRTLESVVVKDTEKHPHIVSQISSVASVGQAWLQKTFFPAINNTSSSTVRNSANATSPPKQSIIFPTASEVRNSIGGYNSGASIHMKIQSKANISQVDFLKPMLCHWSSRVEPLVNRKTSNTKAKAPSEKAPSQAQVSGMAKWLTSKPSAPVNDFSSLSDARPRKARRAHAAPHIKTYTRFSSEAFTSVDWAMMTSANLSTQAWGATPNAGGEVRICSYEIGVLVWPDLWKEEDDDDVVMVPCFDSNKPTAEEIKMAESKAAPSTTCERISKGKKIYVGWRMPYDLPLVPYSADGMPWCATSNYQEPDCMGMTWNRN